MVKSSSDVHQLKSANIFLFMLVEAKPSNLIPVKFKGYTMCYQSMDEVFRSMAYTAFCVIRAWRTLLTYTL